MLVLGGICGIIALFVCIPRLECLEGFQQAGDGLYRQDPAGRQPYCDGNRGHGRIAIESITTIMDDVSNVYVSLTGDQCALTNIHIRQGKLGS